MFILKDPETNQKRTVYEVGDVVHLKSGSQKLVVIVSNEPKEMEGYIRVMWQAFPTGVIYSDTLPVGVVRMADEPVKRRDDDDEIPFERR